MTGWLYLYSISDSIAPNFWKRPVAIKNWLMQNGMVTITFPAELEIIEGKYEDNEGHLILGRKMHRDNSITFSKVDYGPFSFQITFSNLNQTNRVEIPIFHQPDWSRDRYEVTKLKPFEYNLYSDGDFGGKFSDEDSPEESSKGSVERVSPVIW